MNLTIFEMILLAISIAIIVILLFGETPAKAQVFPPYVEGPNVQEFPAKMRCMPPQDFKVLLNTKGLHIIALEAQQDESTKTIFTNEIGSVLVANLSKDGRACIIDIMNMADFSNEFHFSAPKPQQAPKGNEHDQ